MRLTKSKMLSILLFLPCCLLQGQELYYEYDNGANFVCISDDTLAFISPRGGYYYGNYSIEDTIIIPIKNILSNRNYTINTVSCDSSNMEIKVNYWEKSYYFGYSDNTNDTALYLENAERIGIYFGNNEFLVSDYNGIITMDSDRLSMFEDSLHFFVYVDGGLFRADVTIPIKLGVRYCITQKQYGMYRFANGILVCSLFVSPDNNRNLEERFTYDHLNRLTEIWLGNNRTGWMDYDAYGRMAGKTIDNIVVFANAEYDATAKPHAIDYADVDAGSFSEQAVTYTCFDKVKTITQGNNTIEYDYGYNRQRIFMEEHANSGGFTISRP